ncbi:Tyrosine-protein kinase, partial [Caligus rogercresseyi]
HYRVIAKNNKLTIDEDEFFENLSQLVSHYRLDADGLCTNLRKERAVEKARGDRQPHDVDIQALERAGWIIRKEDVSLLERIGKGEFGDVMLGRYKGDRVAIKSMKDIRTRNAQRFLAEATVMT